MEILCNVAVWYRTENSIPGNTDNIAHSLFPSFLLLSNLLVEESADGLIPSSPSFVIFGSFASPVLKLLPMLFNTLVEELAIAFTLSFP